MIPDAEVIIGAYLRAETGARVGGETPSNRDTPWVRMSLLDAGSDGTRADHLVGAYVQLDVYAGSDNSRATASALARSLRSALTRIEEGEHACTVNGADIESFSRIPDDDFEPARERYIVTSTVWMHA